MVTTTSSYTDARYRASTGLGYDGVVRISSGGYTGTGTLLFDGQAILTAAHLLKGQTQASVMFETTAGTQTFSTTSMLVDSAYDASGNHDLALLWLDQAAPVAANRYQLYRGSDEIGQALTMVGYGVPGSGSTGTLSNPSSTPLRLMAGNQFDADIGTLKAALGGIMAWQPLAGTQLVADFDDGTAAHDALGLLASLQGLGVGLDEGLISPGDSGGPAFVKGMLAGVASYKTSLSTYASHPDIDTVANSSFGEIAAWQRVSAFQQWIDQALRQAWTAAGAPKTASEVKGSVTEGNSGTTMTWFMVNYNGTRANPALPVSVDYSTRDGTAKAGSDYITASGTLKIYPGETQALIGVEILGDTVPEGTESFYLDLFNPVGGAFPGGIAVLTGVRTILDNDAG